MAARVVVTRAAAGALLLRHVAESEVKPSGHALGRSIGLRCTADVGG